MIPQDVTEKARRINRTKIETTPSDWIISIGLLENIQASSFRVGEIHSIIKTLGIGGLNDYRREVYGGADGIWTRDLQIDNLAS